MRARRRPLPQFEPLEKDIQRAILSHWRALGVPGSLVAAIPNAGAMGQSGLTCGLPDLLVLSPQLGALTGFIELKRGRGRLSVEQKIVGHFLLARGCPYAICRGRDEPIAQLEAWGAVRRQRAAA
jgi:hypothetical protein